MFGSVKPSHSVAAPWSISQKAQLLGPVCVFYIAIALSGAKVGVQSDEDVGNLRMLNRH